MTPDQLPINDDGSVFHLHLRPEHLADKVMMMGDPARVSLVAERLDSIEFEGQSREFHTVTGLYRGKRITLLSHGIGCDNLDIVMTELDALANVDLEKRRVRDTFRQLTLVRMGTSGGLQRDCPIGTYVASAVSMGMDGLLYFYEGNEVGNDVAMVDAFLSHTQWNRQLARPYFVHADRSLVKQVAFDMKQGITVSASGFYGPQGRSIRLGLTHPEQNERLESFEYDGLRICNMEMESAALAGLAALLGHRAMTVSVIIDNHYAADMNTNYKGSFDELITKVLDRI